MATHFSGVGNILVDNHNTQEVDNVSEDESQNEDLLRQLLRESSLLQDIPILNGQDSSQLEDWLTDIETASELTSESRTKLGQAKSRGLVRTLITKALIAQKSWDEIKDSLHLKISNADIHTSISQFMDIQQTDKESLATYVHRFKWEANRCKFNNVATTIRIFLKGLKMHTP